MVILMHKCCFMQFKVTKRATVHIGFIVSEINKGAFEFIKFKPYHSSSTFININFTVRILTFTCKKPSIQKNPSWSYAVD